MDILPDALAIDHYMKLERAMPKVASSAAFACGGVRSIVNVVERMREARDFFGM